MSFVHFKVYNSENAVMSESNNSLSNRVRFRMENWFKVLSSPFLRNHNYDDDSTSRNLILPSTSNNQNFSVDETTGNRLQSDYTELMGGSIPCPSCNGSGNIPKELESTLIALIPVNDERLKPSKTWMYISIWVSLCIIIGGTLLFLLMPKTVTISSNHMPIKFVKVYKTIGKTEIDFFFMNKVNITSGNYLPVYVTNVTSIIISKFQPWSSDLVGIGVNDTFTSSSPFLLTHETKELFFNNTVQLKNFASMYCQADFWHLYSVYVNLRFDVAVTLRYYYGHQEQVTLSMEQQVCCITTGNCTSSNL